ncbi:MAG: hypothetical protein K9L64_02480 [Candidatus Izimaplasma sp.]|nr:hypothetical protein [Candidatus Izimaplasma bacterium]
MKRTKLEMISLIIFFGAVWGILEASLGYVLHLIPGFIAGTIMFPIVMFILYKAYKAMGSRKAIFYVAMVALFIKSANLLMPLPTPFKVVNPMIAMAIESLLVFAVIPLFESKKPAKVVTGVVIASIGWRLAYVGYLGINFFATGYLSNQIASFSAGVNFVLLSGLLTALIAMLFVAVSQIKTIKKLDNIRINPIISFATLILAFVLTLTI